MGATVDIMEGEERIDPTFFDRRTLNQASWRRGSVDLFWEVGLRGLLKGVARMGVT